MFISGYRDPQQCLVNWCGVWCGTPPRTRCADTVPAQPRTPTSGTGCGSLRTMSANSFDFVLVRSLAKRHMLRSLWHAHKVAHKNEGALVYSRHGRVVGVIRFDDRQPHQRWRLKVLTSVGQGVDVPPGLQGTTKSSQSNGRKLVVYKVEKVSAEVFAKVPFRQFRSLESEQHPQKRCCHFPLSSWLRQVAHPSHSCL
jgi:hypothetical protein